MTFQEIFGKLADMYPEKHFSVRYKVTHFSNKELATECGVYTDGFRGIVCGSTFEEVCAILDNRDSIQPIPEDLPQIEKEVSNG